MSTKTTKRARPRRSATIDPKILERLQLYVDKQPTKYDAALSIGVTTEGLSYILKNGKTNPKRLVLIQKVLKGKKLA